VAAAGSTDHAPRRAPASEAPRIGEEPRRQDRPEAQAGRQRNAADELAERSERRRHERHRDADAAHPRGRAFEAMAAGPA